MRVLVTRAAADAQRTAARLQEFGHEALIAPVTVIVPTEADPPVGPWDAVILTSAHAAPMLSRLRDRERPLFAVGGRTAAAAAAAGYGTVCEAGGDALAVAALVATRLSLPATLLHPTTAHRKAEPGRSLASAGFRLLVWECYEARPVAQTPAPAVEALRARHLDAALHFSRRSAELFIGLAEREDLIPLLRSIPHLCLSADVAIPLSRIGAATVVAPEPREKSLMDCLGEVSPARRA
jgi:uroporphyrinogen-III synthase